MKKEKQELLDGFFEGNIETMRLEFDEGFFDVVILGDILEHLYSPWKTIKLLSKYLRSGGYIIASIPNFRNINVRRVA